MKPSQTNLYFQAPLAEYGHKKPFRDNLSSVVKVGDYIWLACDEGISLERLKKQADGYGEHTSFNLANYITLADDPDSEIDIEGIDYENHYLWITGSHALKRKKPDKENSIKKQIKQLTKVKSEPNRYVLARIPLVPDPETGEYSLHTSCPHPDDPDQLLTAARLDGSDTENELIKALRHDKHLCDFLTIPGKDNGFDVEGLALDGARIFLGLRGPVLRGWAVVLEIETETVSKHTLRLMEIGPNKAKYKKHFLNLSGMGIREITPAGKDLLILAGPTMVLDGTIAVFRWKDALAQTQESNDTLVDASQIERLFNIPHGTGEQAGKDRAEGITLISENTLLVVYDNPADERKINQTDVTADLFPIGGDNRKRRIKESYPNQPLKKGAS